MGRNDVRPPLVRSLRAVARKLGVQDVASDEVGRSAVSSLMSRIRACSGGAADKKEAEKVFAKYEATFAGTAPPAQAALEGQAAEASRPGDDSQRETAPAARKAVRMRGKSFLLTYNWDFMGRCFPDGKAAVTTTEELWEIWWGWKKEVKRKLGVKCQVTSRLAQAA